MLMADTMAIFFVVLAILLSFLGLWLLVNGLWPDAVTASRRRFERGLVLPFFVGLPITAVTVLVVALAANLPGPLGGLTALTILSLFLVPVQIGVSGLAFLAGRRLQRDGSGSSPGRTTLVGGIPLVLSFLFPFLGWFVVLPITMIVGAGGVTLVIFGRLARAVGRLGSSDAAPRAPLVAEPTISARPESIQSSEPSGA